MSPREERRRKVQERLSKKGLSRTDSEEAISSPMKTAKRKNRSKATRKSTTHSSQKKSKPDDPPSPQKSSGAEKETPAERKKRKEDKRLRKERREQKKQRRAAKEIALADVEVPLPSPGGSDGGRSPTAMPVHSSRASSARSDVQAERVEKAEDIQIPAQLSSPHSEADKRIELLNSNVCSLQEQVQGLALLLEQTRETMATGVSAQYADVSNVCSDTVAAMKKMMEEFSDAHQQKMEVQREQLRIVKQEKERAASSTDMDDKRKASEMQAMKRFISTSLEEMKGSIMQAVKAEIAGVRAVAEKPCPRCKDSLTPTHIDNAVTRMTNHFDAAFVQTKEPSAEPPAEARAGADGQRQLQQPAVLSRRQPAHSAVTGGHTSRDSVDLTSPVNRNLVGLDYDEEDEDMAAESPAEAESAGEEEELRSMPRGEPKGSVASAPKALVREQSPASEMAVLMQDSTPGIEETSDAWDVSSISSVDETRGNDETSAAPEDQRASSAHIVGARDPQVERLSKAETREKKYGLSSSLSPTSGGEEEKEELVRLAEPATQHAQRGVWGVEEDGASEEELVVVDSLQRVSDSTSGYPSPAAAGSPGQLTRQSSRVENAEPATQRHFRMEQSSSQSDAPSSDKDRKDQSSDDLDTSVSSSAISTSVESDSSSEEEPRERHARAPVTPSWIN